MKINRRNKKNNSKNKINEGAIIITIISSKVTNLTIIDTPGLISNFNGDANHFLVKKFEEIVSNEIQTESIVSKNQYKIKLLKYQNINKETNYFICL